MVNLHLSKQGIRWPVSRDYMVGSNLETRNYKGLHTINAANEVFTSMVLAMCSNVWVGLVQPHFCFCFLRLQSIVTFVSLLPETHAVATRVSGSKWTESTELDIANGSLCNLWALARGLALHIRQYLRYTVLMSPNKDETAVHCCDPSLSVLVMFSVSKRLSHSITLPVYYLQI